MSRSTISSSPRRMDAGPIAISPVARETHTIVWKPQETGTPSSRTIRKHRRTEDGECSSAETSTATLCPTDTGARLRM